MKEPHRKEPATHPDPESCTDGRKAEREALTGESAGQVSSCEIQQSRVPTPLSEAEGTIDEVVTGKTSEDSAQSQTLSMHGHLLHENREILEMFADNPSVIRALKAIGRTNAMHVSRKSDSGVVPMKPSNNPVLSAGAETVEGRPLAKGNTDQTTTVRTQSRATVSRGLEGVREAARRVTVRSSPLAKNCSVS
jgi:RNA-directed DNA polymerase